MRIPVFAAVLTLSAQGFAAAGRVDGGTSEPFTDAGESKLPSPSQEPGSLSTVAKINHRPVGACGGKQPTPGVSVQVGADDDWSSCPCSNAARLQTGSSERTVVKLFGYPDLRALYLTDPIFSKCGSRTRSNGRRCHTQTYECSVGESISLDLVVLYDSQDRVVTWELRDGSAGSVP
jgi:hypothetical protein